jgi:hypothetical protein
MADNYDSPDEFHQVPVKLYESHLAKAKGKGKYFAKTVNERTLKNEDIAALIAERRGTKWKYAELAEVIRLYCREVGIQLCDGYAVNVGDLFSLRPKVKGAFANLREGVTEEKHPLGFQFRTLRKLCEAARHIGVYVAGFAGTGAFIDTFTDVTTGLVNQKATAGGLFIATGNKIRIMGGALEIGFYFTSPGCPPVKVAGGFAVNEGQRLVGTIPELLPGRPWTLEVRTQYSNSSRPMKEARTIVSNFTVTV